MRATAIVLLVLAAFIAATLRSEVLVATTIEQVRYRPGTTVTVQLENRSSEPLGYNACSWTLEHHGDIGWQAAPHEDERMCTMELRPLAPEQSARAEFSLSEGLPAGRYRLRVTVHRMEAGERLVRRTAPFRFAP